MVDSRISHVVKCHCVDLKHCDVLLGRVVRHQHVLLLGGATTSYNAPFSNCYKLLRCYAEQKYGRMRSQVHKNGQDIDQTTCILETEPVMKQTGNLCNPTSV